MTTQTSTSAMCVSIVASLVGGWSYARSGSQAIGIVFIGAIAAGLAVLGRVAQTCLTRIG